MICAWTIGPWFAGRPVAGQWALDICQVARYCRELGFGPVTIDAQNDFGWAALLAGAASPGLIDSGTTRIGRESLREDLAARGDGALADVPGLLERLGIPQIRQLWPAGQVTVAR